MTQTSLGAMNKEKTGRQHFLLIFTIIGHFFNDRSLFSLLQ